MLEGGGEGEGVDISERWRRAPKDVVFHLITFIVGTSQRLGSTQRVKRCSFLGVQYHASEGSGWGRGGRQSSGR